MSQGFTLQSHTPERGRRPGTTLCCGCCCCCCCLHSIGGLVGAMVASIPAPEDPERSVWSRSDLFTDTNPFRLPRRPASAATLYWLSFFLTAAILVARDWSEGWGWLLMALPAVQLLVSLVVAALVVVLPGVGPKGSYLWSLGRITLGSLAGACAGFLLMGGGCIGLELFIPFR